MFTGRIGYAANNALFYVKGGAAVAKNDAWAAWNNVNFATASNTRWGGTVGVGLEYGFTPNWSFGVEYMHAWLGNNDYAWVDNRLLSDGTTSTSVRTSIWSPSGLTTASVATAKARWSRATDLALFRLSQQTWPAGMPAFLLLEVTCLKKRQARTRGGCG